MKLDSRTRAVLEAARAKRLADEAAARTRAEALKVAAELRSFFYPKQAGFFRSPAKLRATKKTRRAGATTGGVREFLARAIEQPGFRATYAASTRIEARARAWRNDTQNGLVDVLRQFGAIVESRGVETLMLGGVRVEVRDSDLALEFSNGSQIELFGAGNVRAVHKKRGQPKHVVWIDEAQDFTHLQVFYKSVVVPSLQDFEGECWITGTPGVDCTGMFYDITKDDETDGPRLPGWEVHTIAQVDNPFFGKTIEERYERTAQRALTENGWTPDDADFQREIMGRWVKTDARYVYAVHQVPEYELVYAPARMGDDGFPEIAKALEDLPHYAQRNYFLGLGSDLGTTAGFTFTIVAWSLLDPVLYEVCSWKMTGLSYDEMVAHLHVVRAACVLGVTVADAGGGGKAAVMGWSADWMKRYALPIEEAEKTNREQAIDFVNNDIRTGKLRLRKGGALLEEMRRLVWAKLRSSTGRRETDPKTPRDVSDGFRYIHRRSYHHRGIVPEDKPPPGTTQWLEREEREVEAQLERVHEDDGADLWH